MDLLQLFYAVAFLYTIPVRMVLWPNSTSSTIKTAVSGAREWAIGRAASALPAFLYRPRPQDTAAPSPVNGPLEAPADAPDTSSGARPTGFIARIVLIIYYMSLATMALYKRIAMFVVNAAWRSTKWAVISYLRVICYTLGLKFRATIVDDPSPSPAAAPTPGFATRAFQMLNTERLSCNMTIRVSEWPFKAVVDSVWRSPTEVLTYIFCSLIGLALAIWSVACRCLAPYMSYMIIMVRMVCLPVTLPMRLAVQTTKVTYNTVWRATTPVLAVFRAILDSATKLALHNRNAAAGPSSPTSSAAPVLTAPKKGDTVNPADGQSGEEDLIQAVHS